MRVALAFISIFACLASSCGAKTAAPALALTPPPPPQSPSLTFLPAPFLEEVVSTAPVSNTVITWEAILVQFKVDDAERHGLAKFFAQGGEINPILERQNVMSPVAQFARAHTNAVLQVASAPYAARLTSEDSAILLQHMQSSIGVDTLSQPKITTQGPREALLQVSDVQTIVLAGTQNSKPGMLQSTNLSFGPSVSVHLLGRNDQGIIIEAAVRLEEFHGYLPGNSNAPRPKFGVFTMGTRAQLQTNEVLLLGGPVQMNVVKTSERVAYLSDIPAIGRLFTETHVQTNFVRTLLLLRPQLKN